MKKYTSILLLSIFISGSLFSQKLSSKEENKLLEAAEYYYEDEESQNLPKALKLFEKLLKNKPSDPYYKLMTGICYSYLKHEKEKSLEMLLAVKSENDGFEEVDFYLGRAYAVNNRFDEAIASYEKYLTAEDLEDDRKALVRQNIIYCENAKVYLKDTVDVEINNLGPPVNSEYSEYVPVITPDESMMIFTYSGIKSKGGLLAPTGKSDSDGRYYEDIMITYKENGDWIEPVSIGDNINTNGHNASIALSVDGKTLFLYEQTKADRGDIYVSYLKGEEWSKPERLKGDINSDAWEGSATLTSDGKTIYFSSERKGGFGGRDLYSASLQPDGSWGEVTNLGPTINTRFDDDAPFIHPDRRTMYFSSKGHNSMGDYDIFYTYLADEGWDKPKNVKPPVNTIDDDRYYVLSADAKTGYYSTSGRSELGTHDIFSVSPGHFGERPVLALVVGVIQAGKDVKSADISVTNSENGEKEGDYKSNAATGKYMLALTPGNKYKIAIEVEGYETKIDYIDIESLESYVEVEHDFNVLQDEIVGISDELNPLQSKIDNQILQYKKENTADGYDELIYAKIINEKGTVKNAGVQYFLDAGCIDESSADAEITAKINTIIYPDGTTKKMIGPFETLKESEDVKQMLMLKDTACNNLQVKVDDNGIEKSVKQYYINDYTKTNVSNTSIHDKLTGSEVGAVSNSSAIDLQEVTDVDLGDESVEAAEEKKITGLTFKVEVGAVKDTNDFKLAYLSKYGKISSKIYPDGLTRYSFGSFATLKEAEDFKEMLVEKEAESKDAFVTVFVFGADKKVDDLKNTVRKDLGIPLKENEVVPDDLKPCNSAMIDFSKFIDEDLNDPVVYAGLMKLGGDFCAKGLTFKVQIGAYRFPKNYKWNHLMKYGEPTTSGYPDGITRFTQGTFDTMIKAEELRQQIIKSGQKDAWITPFYNGKRILLEELIKVNFYGKSVN
ncbi:MAG: hypothetical protein ACPGSL_02750 [Vicingaceae bacterium]